MSDRLKEIKMQELKNMFFYTFGIVPLDNYDVVGDGITDNRLAIQQAIYDAIEVGAKYIFVTKGEYYYSQTLNKADEVIFIGNSTGAYIKDVEIKQFPINVEEQKQNSIDYSTEEHIIGTWVDGKTIYQRAVEFNNKNFDSSTIIFSNINIDTVIDFKFKGVDNGKIFTDYFSNGKFESSTTRYTISDNNIYSTLQGVTFTKAIFIIEYTKNTD